MSKLGTKFRRVVKQRYKIAKVYNNILRNAQANRRQMLDGNESDKDKSYAAVLLLLFAEIFIITNNRLIQGLLEKKK